MPVRLAAPDGYKPLAFQADRDLSGAGVPYEGTVTAGQQSAPFGISELPDVLAEFGGGEHTIAIRAEYRDSRAGVGAPLQSIGVAQVVYGSLTTEELARLIHRLSRSVVEGFGKGNTPAELYISSIEIT